jgi:hypothetical protein
MDPFLAGGLCGAGVYGKGTMQAYTIAGGDRPLGLFDRLLNFGDPTKDWPVVSGPVPALSRRTMQLEAPRFGEPLESARSLGRPDQFTWESRRHQNSELLYASKGLRLEFEANRLVEVTFFIAPSSCPHPAFKPAQPKSRDGVALGPETGRKRIIELFGEPDPKGSDDEVLQIFHGDTVSDFFLTEEGRLDRWELYLND